MVRFVGTGNRIKTVIGNTDAILAWCDEPSHIIGKRIATRLGAQWSMVEAEQGDIPDEHGQVIAIQGRHQPDVISKALN